MDVNLRGTFAAIREAAKHLADNGRIVNLGSVVAKVGMPQNAIYGAAKASVTILARSVAKELGARGITVNNIAPGPLDNSFFHAAETPQSVAYATTLAPAGGWEPRPTSCR
jgi:NAD(P)-dependent dehydrogenase (short-subunit alcohol dehydrogenase family)